MDFNEYQMLSIETAEQYADPNRGDEETTAMFLALATNGESGELAEKVKKYVREGDDKYLDDAVYEIGDILWYLSQMATLLDADLSSIAEQNIDKLMDRDDRDKILGEGDYR
jgi:NTP pyrophosphatase (non-canonical NTP hydrolase)